MDTSHGILNDGQIRGAPAAPQAGLGAAQSGAPAADEAARLDREFVEIQHEGLAAIRNLARPTVDAALREVEGRFRQVCDAAELDLKDRLREIEAHTKTELADAEAGRAARTPAILAAYESGVADSVKKAKSAIGHAEIKARDQASEADLLLQHQFLLSDTVAQANCERLKKERLTHEKQAAETYQHMDVIRARIEGQMARLGVEALPLSDEATVDPAADSEDVSAFEGHLRAVTEGLEALETIRDGRLFVGGRMVAVLILFCVAVVIGLGAWHLFGGPDAPSFLASGPIGLAASTVVSVVFGVVMHRREQNRIWKVYEPLAIAYARARQALDVKVTRTRERIHKAETRAGEIYRNNPEKVVAKEQYDDAIADLRKKLADLKSQTEAHHKRHVSELAAQRDAALAELAREADERMARARAKHDAQVTAARNDHDTRVAGAKAKHDAECAVLEREWREADCRVERMLRVGDRLFSPPAGPPQDAREALAEHRADPATWIRIGGWQFDWNQMASDRPALAALRAGRPTVEESPVVLGGGRHCSLLLQTDRAGRQRALDTLRVAMLRLLTTQRAGRVRFTIVDPVGLGESFAGFMHLVDYQEALVGSRIWTEGEHIESRLTELTSHMETVIQKYLRNEFPTIDAYNRQAGPLAEPYRYLVIADFPANFTDGAVRRLSSIISSGARCGVHTLIMHDRRLGLPTGMPLEDLVGRALHLVHDGQRFVARDELQHPFPLVLDDPPSEDELTRIMHEVGRGAKDAFRVEVPFDAIAPSAEQRWTQDAATQISIPVGHSGAIRFQNFTLGRGLAQHALMAGKTGSGKSTLLHVIITNLALSYDPGELELYLVDFKKGVEFKTYVTHGLPHARAIAIESDREFGVSVLQRLDAEMTRRGDLFRAVGVQDLPAYRTATGQKMPRTLLIVDEFQVFFAEDDRLAQEASALLDRLVRQGRAFGIHLVLGSQTLAGSAGLARSTIGQMAVRIALQCSEADSQLILDDTNAAARLLSRPGEAIYNDAGGLIAGNSNFQVAWLPDDGQDTYLADVRDLALKRGWAGDPAIVFEGNALADFRQNRTIVRQVESLGRVASGAAGQVWLGEPVAIKEPTGLTLRKQSGANVLIVGQRDDVAQSMLAGSVMSLALSQGAGAAKFLVLGGAADDQPVHGGLRDVAATIPHDVRWVEWREVGEVFNELAVEMQRRIDAGPSDAPSVYLIVNGVQRYRMLRRREDSFSFSASDDGPPSTDKQFADLLRDGPPVGIHILAWSDTLATMERALDRQSMREFDSRILFQMSAADSSNLIDSPEANRLGLYRAILFSEERGVVEKFRPYGPLDPTWLAELKSRWGR